MRGSLTHQSRLAKVIYVADACRAKSPVSPDPKTSRGTRCRILKKCPGQTGTSTKGALAAKGQDGAMADLKVAEWKVVEYQICLAGAAKSPKVARTRMAQHLIVVRNASGNVKLTNRRVGHACLGLNKALGKARQTRGF